MTRLESFFEGCGWKPYFVEGDDPMTMHKKMAETMDAVHRGDQGNSETRPREQGSGPSELADDRSAYSKGLDRSERFVDGQQIEGSFRAHQVPITMEQPEHLDSFWKTG